jgi:hypothetical protein
MKGAQFGVEYPMALLIRSATGDIPVAEALIRDGQKDNGTCMNGVRKNRICRSHLGDL